MIARIGSIVSMVAAAALANYAHDMWRNYSKGTSCTRNLSEFREKFDQRRADIRNPAVMDKALAEAAELCAQGEYDKARKLMDTTIAMCRYNGSCVLKKRS
jgi:hypothetical protein